MLDMALNDSMTPLDGKTRALDGLIRPILLRLFSHSSLGAALGRGGASSLINAHPFNLRALFEGTKKKRVGCQLEKIRCISWVKYRFAFGVNAFTLRWDS